MPFSRRLLFDVVAPAILISWIALETYGALFGPSSYRALRRLEAQAADRAAALDALVARRETLERRANQLNPRSLDPDLVEERVRAVLGYARDGDMVVPRDQFDAALQALNSR